MESGALISDDIVNEQVFSKLMEVPDFLLDGYPRNTGQADELDGYLQELGRPLSGAVLLDVPDSEVIARLSGRLTCTGCGLVTAMDPEGGTTCPSCGDELEVRRDDSPGVVRERLEHYRAQTSPLIEFYSGRLLRVDGVGSVEQVATRIRESLSEWQ